MCIKIYLLYEQIVLPIANRSLNMSKIKKKQKKQKKNNHCVLREDKTTITTTTFKCAQ